MSILRTSKRQAVKSAAKKKPVVHDLKAAYIIPKEDGEKMIEMLGELPSRYYERMVGPMVQSFMRAFRGDITVTIDPNKPAPPESRDLKPILKEKDEK